MSVYRHAILGVYQLLMIVNISYSSRRSKAGLSRVQEGANISNIFQQAKLDDRENIR